MLASVLLDHAMLGPHACCVSRDQMSPTLFCPQRCRPTMPQISVRHSCQSSCKLSSLSHRHGPLGSTGESILPFRPRSTRFRLLSSSVDEWQKDGHELTSHYMSPASRSVSYMMVLMLATAGARLKYDVYYTDIWLRLPSERSAATGRPGSCFKYRCVAHTPGNGDYEPTDPAWSEQVRGIPLRCVPEYRAGARESRDSLTFASPFSFWFLHHGLNRWLKFVVVLLGYGVCKTSGYGSCKMLRHPLHEVPRGIQGANPLARVMSPTHMRLLVDGYRSATATPVLRAVRSTHMDLPEQAEDRSDMVPSF